MVIYEHFLKFKVQSHFSVQNTTIKKFPKTTILKLFTDQSQKWVVYLQDANVRDQLANSSRFSEEFFFGEKYIYVNPIYFIIREINRRSVFSIIHGHLILSNYTTRLVNRSNVKGSWEISYPLIDYIKVLHSLHFTCNCFPLISDHQLYVIHYLKVNSHGK